MTFKPTIPHTLQFPHGPVITPQPRRQTACPTHGGREGSTSHPFPDPSATDEGSVLHPPWLLQEVRPHVRPDDRVVGAERDLDVLAKPTAVVVPSRLRVADGLKQERAQRLKHCLPGRPSRLIIGRTGSYEKIPVRMTGAYFNFDNSLSMVDHQLFSTTTKFAQSVVPSTTHLLACKKCAGNKSRLIFTT